VKLMTRVSAFDHAWVAYRRLVPIPCADAFVKKDARVLLGARTAVEK
jgi:hypothetical protein